MDVDVGKRVLPTQTTCTLLNCPIMGKGSLEMQYHIIISGFVKAEILDVPELPSEDEKMPLDDEHDLPLALASLFHNDIKDSDFDVRLNFMIIECENNCCLIVPYVMYKHFLLLIYCFSFI